MKSCVSNFFGIIAVILLFCGAGAFIDGNIPAAIMCLGAFAMLYMQHKHKSSDDF